MQGMKRTLQTQLAEQKTGRASPVAAGAKGPANISTSSDSTDQQADKAADPLPITYATSSSSLPAAVAASRASTAGCGTLPQQQQQQEQTDAALYRDMRADLADFEARLRNLLSEQQQASTSSPAAAPGTPTHPSSSRRPARMPPRETAFYAALRSVLQQVLAETTPSARHTRLLAAHAWYVGHKPRPIPADSNLAAALAASLSISTPPAQPECPAGTGQAAGCTMTAAGAAGGGNNRGAGSSSVRSPSRSCCSPTAAPATTTTAAAAAAVAAAAAAAGGDGDDTEGDGYDTTYGDSPCSDAAAPECCIPLCSCLTSSSSNHKSGRQNHTSCTDTTTSSITTAKTAAAARAHQLEAAAQAAVCSRWPLSGSNTHQAAGSSGSSSSAGGDAAGEVPGLIPVGCLASSRLMGGCAVGPGSTAAATAAATAVGAARKPGQQQQQQQLLSSSRSKQVWSLVGVQQAAVQADVDGSMRGFARQRARIEENITRRQELAAVAAATSAAAAGAYGEHGEQAGPGASCGRLLQHVDSQHQPSQLTAQLGLTAVGAFAGNLAGNAAAAATAAAAGSKGGAVGVQLVVPDRVKAARKQHLQEGVHECCVLHQKLGVPDAVLSRALLPAPDAPYMSAFAQLPTYHPPAKTAAAGKKKGGNKDKGNKKKKKGAAKPGKSSKSGKAV